MKMVAMMAGTLMVIAGCATTNQAQPVADATISNPLAAANAPAVAQNTDTVRCQRMAITGSRVGKSVCHTEEQWAAIKKQAEEVMEDIGGQAAYQGRAQ